MQLGDAPNQPSEISAAWISAVLSDGLGDPVPVDRIEVETIGGGFLGTVARITITSPHPAAPGSLVAKFAHSDAGTRAEVWDADIYQREARFYRDLRADIPLAVPRPWFVATDREQDRHVILVDDLSSATLYDQLEGCPPERAVDVVEDLATLHRSFWERTADLGGTVGCAVDDEEWFCLSASGIPAMLARDDLSPALRHLTDHYGDIGRSVVERLDRRRTIVHSDARIENVFFVADGSRVWIDWDGIQLGGGATDLAYFMSQSLAIEDRRAIETDLLSRYVDVIGREGYGLDEVRADYRLGIAAGWAVGLAVVGVYGIRDDGAARLVAEVIGRIAAAVDDHDVVDAVR